MRVVVTGASGVLGRACLKTLLDNNIEAIGLAHTRSSSTLVSLDLLDQTAVEKFFSSQKPDFVIHCAAERRPDAAAADEAKATKLNAEVPAQLAKLSVALGFRLVYISTDYVFDGTSPPYKPSDAPNPINFYGHTKREGELAILNHSNNTGIILRVPLLYGETEYNSETAVNVLLDIILDKSGKTYKMDAYQTRLPTSVASVSLILLQLVESYPLSKPLPSLLPPILHFSSKAPLTKYDMCEIISRSLFAAGKDGSMEHILEDKEEPKNAVAQRPKDTTLDVGCLEEWGLEWADEEGGFEGWWKEWVQKL